MKKIALMGICLLIVSSGIIAQDTGQKVQKMNSIKTDLFSPFLRTGVLKYERVFSESMSAQLGAFYTGVHPSGATAVLNGFAVTPEFRFYLSDSPAPNGTYLAPNFRYMKVTVSSTETSDEGSLTTLGLAINLGKQVLLKDLVVIDAWIGPLYAFRSFSDPTGTLDTGIPNADGFGIRIGLAIGLAF